jgi:membrane protein
MKAFSFKGIWILLKDSFKGFSQDKVTKLGASLAYFTIFSIGPLFLVIIFIAAQFLGRQAVEGSLLRQMQEVVGESVAQQVQQIIKNAATSNQGIVALLIGIVTLLLGASSMFGEVQDSINQIWRLKLKSKQTWLLMLKNRLLAFIIIAAMGILLIASLAATALLEGLGNDMEKIFPGISVIVFDMIGQAFTLLIATILFALVFKLLPTVKIKWNDVWPGSVVTALLFIAGRVVISFYISRSHFGSSYGAAGSLVVLLVWIYYSALILYFGAEFTRAYAKRFGSGINPNDYAILTA